MAIDLKRLRRDLGRLQGERPVGRAPGGRPLTGAMASVRALLPMLEQLRAEGFTWPEIAAALAAQGVMQTRGDSLVPITGRRVSALVASVRRQQGRQRQAAERRTRRGDLRPSSVPAAPPGAAPAEPRRLRLSTELTAGGASAPPASPNPISEEALRRAALESVKAILKRDNRT
jgi:hypothetical protein